VGFEASSLFAYEVRMLNLSEYKMYTFNLKWREGKRSRLDVTVFHNEQRRVVARSEAAAKEHLMRECGRKEEFHISLDSEETIPHILIEIVP